MDYEIKNIPLIDICDEVVDCPHSTPKWTNEGIFVLRNSNIKNGRLDLSNPSFTDELHYEDRSRRAKLQAGDLVITREAPMGEVCQIPKNLKCCLGQRMVLLRPSKEKCDGKYLLYALQSKKVQHEIKSYDGTGSTVSNLRIPVLKNLSIPIPSLNIQKNIAQILGTLDKKIELNKSTNETLEHIAKALFKSWFIDFDPVRAKSEGRSTRLPDKISDLFPDSLESSELGEIPTDWKQKNFGEFLIPKRGKIITKNVVKDGSIPVVAGGLNPSYFHNEHNVEGPVVTISGSGANAGFVNLYFDNIWASDCSYISKIESKHIFTSYLFLKTFQKRVFDTQHGAAQPHVNPNDLMRLDFIYADKHIFDTFENLVNPLFEKIRINNLAKKNLEIIRDTLLPKFISGDLRISDAEKIIEEAEI